MYEPERVSTLTLSPMFTNSGTWIVAPVSSVAGLLPPPEAVSPRTPGSVCVTSSSTEAESWTSDGWSSMNSRSTDSFGLIHFSVSAIDALGDRELLVGLLVHEVRVGAVGVEELHLARLGAHGAELLAGAERAVDHGAVGGAAQLGADERAALAGLDVLELEDLEDGALDLDVIAVLELVRGDHVRCDSLGAPADGPGRGARRTGASRQVADDARLLEALPGVASSAGQRVVVPRCARRPRRAGAARPAQVGAWPSPTIAQRDVDRPAGEGPSSTASRARGSGSPGSRSAAMADESADVADTARTEAGVRPWRTSHAPLHRQALRRSTPRPPAGVPDVVTGRARQARGRGVSRR